VVISESDIDGFFKVAQLIQSSVSGIDIASEHVVKFLAQSEEDVYPGKTYKHLRLQLTEAVSSPLFLPKESPSPIETQEIVPEESPEVPKNHTETSVPNHIEHKEEIIEETEPVETEEGEQQPENPSDEGGKERRDQNKRSFRRRPGGRGREEETLAIKKAAQRKETSRKETLRKEILIIGKTAEEEETIEEEVEVH